ncbi:HD domain-containing protein [Demequina flava]|uniref:HD domain-containing protein n=1 Tax=Demequina flava TaxID=1095025 RepID=UPI000780D719|nr:HD domain-containing protein [Demequina flava]
MSEAPGSFSPAAYVATGAHCGLGDLDKLGVPYIQHPARVATYLKRLYPDCVDDVVAVAWLHDVVEDTKVRLEDLRACGFSEDVVTAVDCISQRQDGEKKEPADDYYARVRSHPWALMVKEADLMDNTDPDRLSQLPDKDRERLSEKYAHAREFFGFGDPWA